MSFLHKSAQKSYESGQDIDLISAGGNYAQDVLFSNVIECLSTRRAIIFIGSEISQIDVLMEILFMSLFIAYGNKYYRMMC